MHQLARLPHKDAQSLHMPHSERMSRIGWGTTLAGKTHELIDRLIESRSHGDAVAAAGVRVRLLLQGIDPDQHTSTSEDDPAVIAKIEQMMLDLAGTGGTR